MKKRRNIRRNNRTQKADFKPKRRREGVSQTNQRSTLNGSSVKLMARFIAVGLLNTVVGYGIYASLILFNLPYLVALFMATVAGVIFNYFSIGQLVFKSRGGRVIFAKFITAYGAVYCINAIALEVLIKHFQLNPYIGQALCVPLSVLISWLLMNHWVYKKD